MKKTIPLDSRKAGALVLVLVLGLAVEVANADFTFGEPVNVEPPINSSGEENLYNLIISADGLEMYVSSDRSGVFDELRGLARGPVEHGGTDPRRPRPSPGNRDGRTGEPSCCETPRRHRQSTSQCLQGST